MKGLAFIDIDWPPVWLHAGFAHHIIVSLLSSLVGILMDENSVVIATYLLPTTFLFVMVAIKADGCAVYRYHTNQSCVWLVFTTGLRSIYLDKSNSIGMDSPDGQMVRGYYEKPEEVCYTSHDAG